MRPPTGTSPHISGGTSGQRNLSQNHQPEPTVAPGQATLYDIGAALVEFVVACAESDEDWYRRREQTKASLREQGYRLVGGGQEDDDHWTVTDDLTGQVLASGHGIESYDIECDRHEDWYHVDHVTWDTEADEVTPPAVLQGLPMDDWSALKDASAVTLRAWLESL